MKPHSVSEQKKAAQQGSFCSLGDIADAKKVEL